CYLGNGGKEKVLTVKTFLKDGKCYISFTDTGPGISEEILPKIFDPSRLDERIYVNDEEAFDTTRKLAIREGVFVGMSSGAAMHVALKIASELRGGVIVVILPDRGDRYLSTSLFASICSKCPP
ncbi:MAG: pyridoxal-phosphate dependent enzyme, partial [Thermodesulfovibrio sp.]|nr:pyridoxal-phosphate dependent enzyme [Thermodesulfovibrio sp.]